MIDRYFDARFLESLAHAAGIDAPVDRDALETICARTLSGRDYDDPLRAAGLFWEAMLTACPAGTASAQLAFAGLVALLDMQNLAIDADPEQVAARFSALAEHPQSEAMAAWLSEVTSPKTTIR